MCLSSLPSIETSSERVAAAPPPFLETAACWEKDGEREQGEKKEGNKVEGWVYLFAFGLDYQQR